MKEIPQNNVLLEPLVAQENSDLTQPSSSKVAITIYVYSLDQELLYTFPSSRAAAKHFECDKSTIIRYAQSKKIFQGKYIFSLNSLTPKE